MKVTDILWPQWSWGELAPPRPKCPTSGPPTPALLPTPHHVITPGLAASPAGHRGALGGWWGGVGTGRASLCCLLLLLPPGLQQPLHHHLGAILLVQGPEVLLFQGAPVAEDGQPGAGRWPHMGSEFNSLEPGPGSPKGGSPYGAVVKGGISFTATVNKLEVTASHPKFLSQAPSLPLPRLPR